MEATDDDVLTYYRATTTARATGLYESRQLTRIGLSAVLARRMALAAAHGGLWARLRQHRQWDRAQRVWGGNG